MTPEYSPFTPGQPASADLFVGRNDELERLSDHVGAAAQGQLHSVFIAGERGIGKSSLAAYVKAGAITAHSMVGVHVSLGACNTLEDAVRAILEELIHESKKATWFESVSAFFGRSVESADLFGLKVTFTPSPDQLIAIVRNFPRSLFDLVSKIRARNTGLVLVLDDINASLADSQHFADWLKATLDQIALNYQMPLCIIVAALDERRESMIKLNLSLARNFDLVRIEPWSDEETAKFFKETFAGVAVTVEQPALNMMVQYTGGLPTVAHEIGDAAFRIDTDKKIDTKDAAGGIVRAARSIGEKHIQETVVKSIRSPRYKTILQKLAEELTGKSLKFDRGTLLKLVPQETGSVDNFLQRMKELGVIESDDDEGVGCYRLTSYILHIYLLLSLYVPAQKGAAGGAPAA